VRKALGIVLYVIGGYFLWMVTLLAFVNVPQTGAKWIFIAAVAVLAAGTIGGGVALRRFQHWRREVGIVLLCTPGFTAFGVFALVCVFLSEELRKFMRPDIFAFWSDYVTGGAVAIAFAGLGGFLLNADRPSVAAQAPSAMER
jgi:hypothetical protein